MREARANDEWDQSRPGHRSGAGSDSVLRYLQEELASKPQELDVIHTSTDLRRQRSLARFASRVRRALLNVDA
ncbi:hypothetical protein [Ramlibacter sp.]|uniref:hypothetical protein n=1 Tax=Ramlibacter sp. TaxID=1917967 RepID=UPI002BCE2DB0|nr:hypothetical protein [Ramlibacter sp.]HWI81395.1 hypothetical protein [Ramlibacter sp.]